MDDEFEERVIRQICASNMKLLSRFAFNFFNKIPKNLSFVVHCRPELFLGLTLIFLLICAYFQLQVTELNTSSLFKRILWKSKASIDVSFSKAEKNSWDKIAQNSAVYAVQGRRNHMEDRFHIDENINASTNVAIFSLFDGHGGTYAAQHAKDVLVKNLCNKITEFYHILENNDSEIEHKCNKEDNDEEFLKEVPSTGKKLNEIDTEKLNYQKGISMLKNQQTDVKPSPPPKSLDAKCYILKGRKIDYTKMIHDEIRVFDHKLVETAKRNLIIAGSTAIIAIIDNTRLIVANVGDSRGVMCDSKGVSVPLSFDHRPQAAREHKRIQEAGGFIAFKGVWRVSGILATSRSLGDYPLKPKLVIADPDILEFELADHKPQFIVLASDGLWDTFSNEEAVAFIKNRIDEPHFGAKSLTIASYERGSVDNITVIVVVFKNGKLQIGSSVS